MKFTRKNGVVSAAAGNGKPVGLAAGPASVVSLVEPSGLASDSEGKVIFFDRHRSHIRVLDLAEDFVSAPIVDFESSALCSWYSRH
jgi:hypothetical protein